MQKASKHVKNTNNSKTCTTNTTNIYKQMTTIKNIRKTICCTNKFKTHTKHVKKCTNNSKHATNIPNK